MPPASVFLRIALGICGHLWVFPAADNMHSCQNRGPSQVATEGDPVGGFCLKGERASSHSKTWDSDVGYFRGW